MDVALACESLEEMEAPSFHIYHSSSRAVIFLSQQTSRAKPAGETIILFYELDASFPLKFAS